MDEKKSNTVRIGRVLRLLLTAATAILVVWSFFWFATRPLRQQREREGRVELTLLHWGAREEDEIVRSLCESFERKYSHIKVNRINASAGYTSKLQTMTASGDPPDVFFWNAYMLPDYVHLGIIRPLDDLVENDPEIDPDAFFPQTLNAYRFDGERLGQGPLYGVPSAFTTIGFFYNKDLFDRVGVEYPTDDWTWEEFEEKANALAAVEGLYGAEFQTWDFFVRLFLWTWDLDILTPDLKGLRTGDPEVVGKLQMLRDWRFAPQQERMFTSSRSMVETGRSAFQAGRVGMFGPVGRWPIPGFRQMDAFNWDFAALPRGSSRDSLMFVAAWCLAAEGEHPEESWLLARHLASPEAQALNSSYGLSLPTLREVAWGPSSVNPDIPPSRDDLFLKSVEHSRAMQWPMNSRFQQYFGSAMDECLRMGTNSVEESLRDIQRNWDNEQASPLRRARFPAMPWARIFSWTGFVLLGLAFLGILAWWRRRPRGMDFREECAGYMLVLPWAIGFLALIAGPMFVSFLLTFTKWSGVTTLDTAQFVGFGNWSQMLTSDPTMRRAFWVTVYYVVLMVPVGQIAALSVAVLMNNEVKGIHFFRSAWYLPSVLAGVGIAVMWRWVFDAEFGLLNQLLEPILALVNLRPPEWFLRDAEWFGIPAFVIANLWNVGGGMLIYLAGLNAIPRTLYEAAEIDGAGRWQRFRHITLPMLSPVILFSVIMAIIGSFQVFTQAFVMTGGGPGDATRFYVLYLWNMAFESYEMGYGAAMAWLLFAVILVLSLWVMRGSRKRVFYEGSKA